MRDSSPFCIVSFVFLLKTRTSISIDDVDLLALFGRNDSNLSLIEKDYGVSLVARGDRLLLKGPAESIRAASGLLEHLIEKLHNGGTIGEEELRGFIQQDQLLKDSNSEQIIATYKGPIRARTDGQVSYLKAIAAKEIVFAVGPAGTGKTYLAVAAAVAALRQKCVSRLVLARPAVEAGERLGFLPGALEDKVHPYLRPLYDALQNLLEPERLRRFQEMQIIEIVPLAYMRGRTLDDAFIILDEAQNTTPQQMKMFLTRLGSRSKAVVTGDITQTDLPQDQPSGLVEVQKVLTGIARLTFVYLSDRDVIRNPLVQHIIRAYECYEQESLRMDACAMSNEIL